jgi:hypothetical protein
MFMRYSSDARYMLSDVLDRLDGVSLVCEDLHLVESCKLYRLGFQTYRCVCGYQELIQLSRVVCLAWILIRLYRGYQLSKWIDTLTGLRCVFVYRV